MQITSFARARILRPVLQRAVARGEITTTEISPRLARLPFDLMRNESMIYGMPVSDAAIAEIIDEVVLPVLAATPRES